MKIGEWDGIGSSRALIAHQLGELGAQELAAHVSVDVDRGRQRILVATDIGLLDCIWSVNGAQPDATWSLRGGLVRWPSVRGLRLQTDAEWDPATRRTRSLWRLVAEDPRIELTATQIEATDHTVGPLLAFARACLERAGQ